ncbi:hypothetical protein BDQ17DRAFT_1429115 [Cyathus striatus]|nr:hypothetical protein BDQ17DRAFT_1429115 [Cyathus striatus]
MLIAKEAWNDVTSNTIAHCWNHTKIQGETVANVSEPTSEISIEENTLMESVKELKRRNRIFGPPPTLDNLVNPQEEQEVGDSPYRFEGGDNDIVKEVEHEMAVERGEVIEIDDSESSDGEEVDEAVTRPDAILLCERLEKACLQHGNAEFSLNLLANLRQFRAHLRGEDFCNAKQKTLENFFSKE